MPSFTRHQLQTADYDITHAKARLADAEQIAKDRDSYVVRVRQFKDPKDNCAKIELATFGGTTHTFLVAEDAELVGITSSRCH